MPKEVSFNIKGNSNIATLVKELQNLKDAAAAVNNISGGGTGGGSGASQRGMMPKMNLWDKSLRDAQKYQNRELNKLAKPTGTGGGTGGGLMGALGMGAAAGGAAAGVFMLISVLKDNIKQSQIVSKMLGTLGKLFGLLIDLVLLPFLPIMIFALLGLTSAILKFAKWWGDNNPTNFDPNKQDPVIQTAYVLPGLDAFLLFLKIFNKEMEIAKALWDKFGAQFIKDLESAWASITKIGEALLSVFNPEFYKGLVDSILKMWTDLVNDPAWAKLSGFITDYIVTPLSNLMKAILSLPKLIEDAKTFVMGFFTFLKDGIVKELEKIFPGISGFVSTFLTTIELGFKRLIWAVLYQLVNNTGPLGKGLAKLGVNPGEFPQAASGGFVAQTGLAVIHKGETVVPAGQGGNVTLNFYGYQDDKFIAKVKDVMRKEGARYMA
jgi:hypothetical protein